MNKFFVGTAGWSYKDWEGIVYPTQKSTGFHALPFLAEYINFVEVNSTFYRPPVVRICLSWVNKVQHRPEFLFAIKLHQSFTHGDTPFTIKEVDEFKIGIEPVRSSSRLAAILVQFPWSFKNNPQNREYLDRLVKAYTDYPMALEVRHGSWNQPDFVLWLKSERVALCNIDQPVINESLGPTAIQTHPEFSYVRLHGRNYKNWFKQDAGRDARYNYLYPEPELDEWVDRIKDLGKKSQKVFVITNNHYQGQALANALQIKNKLTGEKLDVPLDLLKQYPLLRDIIKKIGKGDSWIYSIREVDMTWWENRFLKVKKNILYLEDRTAEEVAEAHGTPLFVYSSEQIRVNYRKMLRFMQNRTHREPRICYALKANSHPEVLKALFEEGAWIDAVSPGEVVLARNMGFPAGRILFTGTSLSLEDIRKVLCQKGVLLNIDAAPQLDMILEARDRWFKHKPIRLAVRMNSGIGKGFSPKTTTGGVTASDGTPIKFGIQKDQILTVFKRASDMGISPVGLHQHIGSGWSHQDMALAREAADIQISVASELQSQGFLLEFLDFGGGFRQRFTQEQKEFSMQEYISYIDRKITEARLNIKAIVLEPGQSLVGNAGVLLLRVEYMKNLYGNIFACVNSGTLNSLPRPAIYPDARHQIVHCSRVNSQDNQTLSVAGNLCETGDLFGQNIHLPVPERGDILAVLNAGAYCRSMASSYNLRDFPKEIVI